MVNQSQSCDLKDLVQKFIPESIGREIEKATSSIYPLQNVYIRKVKILKAPKFDLGKLMEVSFFIFLFTCKFKQCRCQLTLLMNFVFPCFRFTVTSLRILVPRLIGLQRKPQLNQLKWLALKFSLFLPDLFLFFNGRFIVCQKNLYFVQ